MVYDCGWSRIDSIVIDTRDAISIKQGKPHVATPHPPTLDPGETVIANVWVPGRLVKLTAESIYPIVEPVFPEPRHSGSPAAAKLLPKTWAKIKSSEQPQHNCLGR